MSSKLFRMKLAKLTEIHSFANIQSKNGTKLEEDLCTGENSQTTRSSSLSATFKKSKIMSSLNHIPSMLLDQYEILEKIGQGNQATVYKVQNKISEEMHAAKIYYIRNEEEIALIEREVEILSQLSNEGVIRYINFYKEENKEVFALVTEYFPSITLESFIENCSISKHDENNICQQILNVVKFLHTQSIAHRDLTLGNILINPQNLQVKIIDFGLSRKNADFTSSPEGNPLYRPPPMQIFENLFFADMWNLSLIFMSVFMKKKITTKKVWSYLHDKKERKIQGESLIILSKIKGLLLSEKKILSAQ